MKKTLLILAAALLLTGCTTADDMTTLPTDSPLVTTTNPTQSPMTSPDTQPQTTGVLPGVIDGVEDATGIDATPDNTTVPESTGVTSMDRARRVIEQIEDELERLSEVDDAEVVLAGNKAAVALEFDDQYHAGIDDRLRSIVKERIDSVISGISTVAITADAGIMDAIESLGERLDAMSDMTELQSDLDAIIKKINVAQA